MSLLHGYYTFQLQKVSGSDNYILANTKHSGKHNDHFFELFTYDKPVKFKKLTPADILDGYTIYPLSFGDSAMLFETEFSFLHPFGLVEIDDSPDCIMFQIFEDNTVDVWISEGNIDQSSQLLNMFRNGELLNDMVLLLNRLEDGNATSK